MFFKDIKPESTLYVYNQQANTLNTARVVSVSQPHYDNYRPGQSSYNDPYAMYVDIVLDIEGNTTPPYVCPEKSEIVYANQLVLCPDITPILKQVEAVKNQAEQQLAQKETLEERVKKCTSILTEWNPTFKREMQNENRIKGLEDSVGRMEKLFEQFMKEWNGKK